jgi:phosphoenolpyruvate phosphomutase
MTKSESLAAQKSRSNSSAQRIRTLLSEKAGLLAIGAHDGLTGRLGQNAGFDLIWGSGFEISASHGLPDANILTMSDLVRQCQLISDVVDVPVIADCDNGFGNAINAAVTVQKLYRAGVAGACIEDNTFPKRCSFYADVHRELVPVAEHALKIKACRDAVPSDDFFLIARTEALIAGEDLSMALDRAHAYAEAGADAILVHSKQSTADELERFAAKWCDEPVPLVAVPTTYDTVPAEQLFQMGYRIVIFANHTLRSEIKAVETNLQRLRAAGHASILRNEIAELGHVFDLVGLPDLQRDERAYLTLPTAETAKRPML